MSSSESLLYFKRALAVGATAQGCFPEGFSVVAQSDWSTSRRLRGWWNWKRNFPLFPTVLELEVVANGIEPLLANDEDDRRYRLSLHSRSFCTERYKAEVECEQYFLKISNANSKRIGYIRLTFDTWVDSNYELRKRHEIATRRFSFRLGRSLWSSPFSSRLRSSL